MAGRGDREECGDRGGEDLEVSISTALGLQIAVSNSGVLLKGILGLLLGGFGLIEGRLRADPHKNYMAVSRDWGCLLRVSLQ